MDEDIRVYSFPTSGYIAGIPGRWSGGSRVTVRESTKEVLDVWPKPVEQATPDEPPAMPIEPVQQIGG